YASGLFFTLAMHLRLLTKFPLRHLRLPLRPAQQRFASQTPRLLDQPLLRSVRLLQIAFAILYRQGYRRDTVSNVRMAAQKGKQPFIAQIRARHQLRPPKSPPTKLTPHRVESHPSAPVHLTIPNRRPYSANRIVTSRKPAKFRHGRATVINSLRLGVELRVRPSRNCANLKRDAKSQECTQMTQITFAPTAQPAAIPIREALPWVIFAGLLLMLAVYFVGAEEGATSIVKGMYVHEFVHDGRHLLGFPGH